MKNKYQTTNSIIWRDNDKNCQTHLLIPYLDTKNMYQCKRCNKIYEYNGKKYIIDKKPSKYDLQMQSVYTSKELKPNKEQLDNYSNHLIKKIFFVNKKKVVIHLLLMIVFVINNWKMDIATWFRTDSCATNGLIDNCNQYLMYHLNWYISISIAIYFMICYILKIVEE